MKKYKCIAIDDEPLALRVISEFCKRRGDLELRTFDDPMLGAQAIEREQPDIIFLDIEMNDVSGLDIAKSIPKHSILIFSTAFAEYAVDGFDLNATDFLHKPFAYSRFTQAIERAIESIETRKRAEVNGDTAPKIVVKSDYKNITIYLKDILYFESMENYVKIYTVNNEVIMTIATLKSISCQLPDSDFIRVHKSYIVARSKIKSFDSKVLTLKHLAGVKLPIGRSYPFLL